VRLMRYHAQRQHVVYSLDSLLYELFLCSYLLDPSIIRLIFRALSQSQLSRPRDMDRTLRFFFLFACLINTGPILRHIVNPSHYEERGLLLDFIGRATPPARVQLIFLDLAIFVLQIITLVIAYESGQSPSEGPDVLAFNPLDSYAPLSDGPSSERDGSDKLDVNEPILHLRLRPTVQRILHPPALRQEQDLPMPNTSRNTATDSTLGRIWTLVQRRVLEQEGRVQTVGGGGPGAGTGRAAPGQAAGDAGGRRTENRVPGAMPPAG